MTKKMRIIVSPGPIKFTVTFFPNKVSFDKNVVKERLSSKLYFLIILVNACMN